MNHIFVSCKFAVTNNEVNGLHWQWTIHMYMCSFNMSNYGNETGNVIQVLIWDITYLNSTWRVSTQLTHCMLFLPKNAESSWHLLDSLRWIKTRMASKNIWLHFLSHYGIFQESFLPHFDNTNHLHQCNCFVFCAFHLLLCVPPLRSK